MLLRTSCSLGRSAILHAASKDLHVWIAVELAKEFLTLCINRLKGLNKLELVDAGFSWTDSHSRQIQVRLQVQKEVFNNTIIQQEFVVKYEQCDMCKLEAADIDEWQAVFQV